MTEWIEYRHRMNFWHHITPKDTLADEQCLVDHFHLNSEWIISVEVKDYQFLDVKMVKKAVREIMKPLEAPLPMLEQELKKLADSSGNVGQAGGLNKPDNVKSINQTLKIEDASAEFLLMWLRERVMLHLLLAGYTDRKIKIWFRETENYSFSVD